MSARRLIWVLSICVVVLGFFAVAIRRPRGAVTPEGEVPGIALQTGTDVRIGESVVVDDVTLFPVYATFQRDPGPITTLPAALGAGTAEVRELGSDSSGFAVERRAGPQVNTLLIDNRGDLPVYVLGGTVVKGGNQDRQIGQDFIVAAHTQVPVDAFCVEHGRWNGNRDGSATGGKFVAMDQLAVSSVRVAGQYESNQGEVWAEVAKVNSTAGKSAASGTLLATLDDTELVAKRRELSRRLLAKLAEVAPQAELVGTAYAVGGSVRGVRWFASHRLFGMFQETLANTAAADAIAARGGTAPRTPPRLDAKDVKRFMAEIDSARAEDKSTQAGNVNTYRKAKAGYGSSTNYKPAAAAPPMPISKDYAAK